MRRTAAVALLALGLVLAPIAAAAAPGLAVGSSDTSDARAAQSDAFSPGERLAGAIGAEHAELDGEVGARSFGVALSRAETNDSAAGVVRDRLDRIRNRLADLEARNASLADRYENRSLSRGAYAAQVAALEAERASLARQLNATAVAVDRLPAAALEARGVNASAIDRLRNRADELGGPAVRDLARSIAGPRFGEADREGRDRDEIPGLDEDGLPGERGDGEDDDADRGDRDERGNGDSETDGDTGGSDGSGDRDGDASDGDDGDGAGASDGSGTGTTDGNDTETDG